MANPNTGVAVLIGAVVIGGAILYATRKKKEEAPPLPPATPEPGVFANPGAIDEGPAWFPPELSTRYETCYDNPANCSTDEVNAILGDMLALGTSLINDPGKVSELAFYYDSFVDRTVTTHTIYQPFRFRSADPSKYTNGIHTVVKNLGVKGRHVGRCSCEERQKKVGEEACCEACARGEKCKECGH